MYNVVSDYTKIESSSNIKVYVRARPLDPGLAKIVAGSSDFITIDPEDDRKIVIKDPDSTNRKYGEVNFQFDRIFWDNSQDDVFRAVCQQQVDHVLNGYNSCCFAYGKNFN